MFTSAKVFLFTLFIPALLWADKSETFLANWWPGEYPAGLTISKNTTVYGRKDPEIKSPQKLKCELPSGLVLHPWSMKRPQVQFSALWKTQTFLALADDSELQVVAGEKIEKLAYTAEGYCALEVKGEVVQGMCPEMNEEMYQLQGAPLANPEDALQELWVYAPCTSGRYAWIEVKKNPILGLDYTAEMISDYGAVKEDRLISQLTAAEIAMTEVLNRYSMIDSLLKNRPTYSLRDQKSVFPLGTKFVISRNDEKGSEMNRIVLIVDYRGKISNSIYSDSDFFK